MSYSNPRDMYINPTNTDFNTNVGEDTFLVSFSQQVQIHKIGITLTSSQTGTSVVDFEVNSACTDDARALGTVNIPASSCGKFVYLEKAAPLGVIKPGEWITVDSTKTGTAPTGQIIIEYSVIEEALGDSNEVATT